MRIVAVVFCALLLLGGAHPAMAKGDTLTIAMAADAKSLDPHGAPDSNSHGIGKQIYESLVKFDADKKLQDFIQEKLSKLDRFLERAVNADVILKLDKDDDHGNKVATINIEIPGGNLVAERHGKSFEEAVDLCIDAIKKQNEKYKDKFK